MKSIITKLITVVFLLAVFTTFSTANSDIDKIKERVVEALMKSEVDDSRIATLVETIKEDGTWPGIDYTDISRTGFQHVRHYGNMISLARANEIIFP